MSRIAKLIASVEEHADEMELVIPKVEDVTPEDEEEADHELEYSEIEHEELEDEIEETTQSVKDMEEEVVAIENYMEILQFGIESKEFSVQLAAAVENKLSSYREVGVVSVPALEDFNKDIIESYYVASLEAAGDVVKKIKDSIAVIQGNLSRKAKALGTPDGFAKATNTKADALLKQLNNAKGDEATVRIASVASRLGVDGKFPSDVVGAAKTDLKNRQLIVTKYQPATESFFVKTLEVLTLRESPFIPDEESEKVLKIKHPTELLPKDVLDGKGLFSAYIEVKHQESDSDKKVTQLINYVSTRTSWKAKSSKSVPAEIKLSSGDVKAILTAVKSYAAFVKTATLPDFAALDVPKKFTFEKGMKPVVFNGIVRAQFSNDIMVIKLLTTTRHVALALLQLAERAIKEMEKEKKAE